MLKPFCSHKCISNFCHKCFVNTGQHVTENISFTHQTVCVTMCKLCYFFHTPCMLLSLIRSKWLFATGIFKLISLASFV